MALYQLFFNLVWAWGHPLFLGSNDVIHWKWTLQANVSVNYLSESTLLLRSSSFHFIHSVSPHFCVFVSLRFLHSLSTHLHTTSFFICSHFSDLHVEGLFRVPGHSLRQAALREMLNAGTEIDLDTGDFHPNDAATLLKSFLGELPEPLLTHRHYHAHLKIGGVVSLIQAFLSLLNIKFDSDQCEVTKTIEPLISLVNNYYFCCLQSWLALMIMGIRRTCRTRSVRLRLFSCFLCCSHQPIATC